MALTPEEARLKNLARLRERRRQDPEGVRAKERASRARWRARLGPEKAYRFTKHLNLRNAYGISLAEYESRLTAQGGVCALCFQPSLPGTVLYVDHDHRTRIVRGLLCPRCNMGMVAVDASVGWGARADAYWQHGFQKET